MKIHKILLVEDTLSIQRAAQRFLDKEKDKFELKCANNGFDAISVVKAYRPDLIFLDVEMPKLNGLDTCNLLRAMPEFEETPIVMLSGLKTHIDKVRGQVSGANDYLTKPFSAEELIKCIYKNLELEMD